MQRKLAVPSASTAADVVDRFLELLLAGDLQLAAQLATPDIVFLGRHGWHGEATPFREDARFLPGSLRQMPDDEVSAIPLEKQRVAFETPIRPNERVFFAIIVTPASRATLGIITRQERDGLRVCRLFDTRQVRSALLQG